MEKTQNETDKKITNLKILNSSLKKKLDHFRVENENQKKVIKNQRKTLIELNKYITKLNYLKKNFNISVKRKVKEVLQKN